MFDNISDDFKVVLEALANNTQVSVYCGCTLLGQGYIIKLEVDHPCIYITLDDSNLKHNISSFEVYHT